MFAAILFFSFIPLVIVWSGAVESPFLFNAGWRFGFALGTLAVVFGIFRKLLFRRETLKLMARPAIGWALFWVAVGNFDTAIFTWAARYVDVPIATILFATWPTFLSFANWVISPQVGVILRASLFLLVSLSGFLFVGASHTGDFGRFDTPLGLLLAVLAAVAAAVGSIAIERFSSGWDRNSSGWDRNSGAKLPPETETPVGAATPGLMGTLLGWGVGSAFTAALSAGIGVAVNEPPAMEILGTGFIAGLLLLTPGSILVTKFYLTANNPNINALSLVIPMLSLVWLFSFTESGVARLDYFVIGAAAIITANVLAEFESEIRWGFKVLILSLGIGGIVVYFRDDFFAYLGVEHWQWTASGYFGSLALSATVFTLLLAFRVGRLVARSGEEERLVFRTFRIVEMLVQGKLISGQTLGCILRIDAPRNPNDLKAAYIEARGYLTEARTHVSSMSVAELQLLSEAESNLDSLVRSKQLGMVLAEKFALFVFAVITVFLALLSIPDNVEGWTRWLVDLFAMLISAVIIFLFVNVLDLQGERDEPKLEPGPESGGYAVRISDTDQGLSDQWMSVVAGLTIFMIFIILLSYKWLDWFSWVG